MGNMKINGNAPRPNGSPAANQRGGSVPRRGGRGRGGHPQGSSGQGYGQQQKAEVKIPASDFDFEASNKKFDKSEVGKQAVQALYAAAAGESAEQSAGPVAAPAEGAGDDGKEEDILKEKVYNPKASFFDNISSDFAKKAPTSNPSDPSSANPSAGGRGRGRGGGYGRARRDEEREKNVQTFGEPGGVGLLGPGGYVGGYGGYRGRRRGRGKGRGGSGNRGGAVVVSLALSR